MKLLKRIPMSMRYGDMPKYAEHDLDKALENYYLDGSWKNLRFGQFCLQEYDNIPRPWPDLFYEKETINVIEMLKEKMNADQQTAGLAN